VIDVAELDSEAGLGKSARRPGERDWRAIADRECEELRSLIRNTPSSRPLRAAGKSGATLHSEDAPTDERLPDSVESRSVRLGMAFHEAMERVDLIGGEGKDAIARELSARYKLDGESVRNLNEMMRITLSSSLLERVRSAASVGGKILRELPFICPLGSAEIEEGKIDLLFEEEGGWIVVDYKTDRLPENGESIDVTIRRKYSSQIRAYLHALQSIPIKVLSAYVLLARTGDAVQMT